jgi:acyl-CoA dehydrogenase
MKWEPELRSRFAGERNRMSFATGFLFAMSESGLYCPLCMTDGVALLIDRYCKDADKERLMPRIYTDKPDELYTGAMFLTEKAGGSDVGANLVRADHKSEDRWLLNGEKWFCSNANAEIIFALARTNPEIKGTRGLGIFLLEPKLPDGSKNAMELVRLKDKLGTRSMASGEFLLNNAEATLVGGETEGFKIMTDMINLSRLYNSVAAISAFRRALIEAFQYLSFRNSFGKNALEHALLRTKLYELGALYLANFYTTWRAIEALDNAENGDRAELSLLRMLTPMVKKSTAETAVYAVRESMELMGGMGYIEDGVMPKTMRDVMVLPIWEGAGNIMVLDMLRAMLKTEGLTVMLSEIETIFSAWATSDTENQEKWQKSIDGLRALEGLLSQLSKEDKDVMEASAKPAFSKLTEYYQLYCLLRYFDEDSAAWINPAIEFYLDKLQPNQYLKTEKVPSVEDIQALIAWSF